MYCFKWVICQYWQTRMIMQTPWPSLLLMQLKLDVSSNNRSSPTNVHISGRIYGEISHNLSASPDIELEFSTLFITSGSFFQQEPTCTYITYNIGCLWFEFKIQTSKLVDTSYRVCSFSLEISMITWIIIITFISIPSATMSEILKNE